VARLSVHDAVVVTSNQTPTRGATFTPDAAKLVSSWEGSHARGNFTKLGHLRSWKVYFICFLF